MTAARARRMSEATRAPVLDRRAGEAGPPIEAAGVFVPRAGSATIDVDGRAVALTNLDRLLYPVAGFTKADLVAYALTAAPALLPALVDRALTVGRFPGGVDGRGFAQAEIPGRPAWVDAAPIALSSGEVRRFTIARDRATLAWLAQMGALELHSFLGLAHDLERPTHVVFDLDPGSPAGVLEAARVALLVAERLAARGLSCTAKTSGSVGIHVLAPAAGATYAETRALATAIASELAAARPDLVVAEMRRAARAGRVLVDARQNSARLTTVVPWSLRATPLPSVSTPVGWDELAGAARPEDLWFSPARALARVRPALSAGSAPR